MFSSGQIAFAIFFAIGFIIIIVFTYRKDYALHLKNYKGVKWVAIAFLTFIAILFTIKYALKD